MKTLYSLTSLFISFSIFAAVKPSEEMNNVIKNIKKERGDISTMTVDKARMQPAPLEIVKKMEGKDRESKKISLKEIKDITIQGARGDIPARVYRPEGKGLFPVIMYFHGGGWVTGNINAYDLTPKNLASLTNAVVISVGYRKAPEHKFPAAHDDAYAAYSWVLKNASEIGGDPQRVAVSGEGAGGNLALNVAISARDRDIKMPQHTLMLYPIAGTNLNTPSYKENAKAVPLNASVMNWYFKNYLRNEVDLKDTRINLLNANLKGLPPTTIITADIDPLKSEGEELAKNLKKAGVDVSYENFTGVTHDFFAMDPVLKKSEEAQQFVSKELKDSLTL